eukprot:jgi/Tetstr1/463220/TSEL_008151.t1
MLRALRSKTKTAASRLLSLPTLHLAPLCQPAFVDGPGGVHPSKGCQVYGTSVAVFASTAGAYVPPAAKVGRLNHVAIAVPDLSAAAELYRTVFGAQVSQPQALPEHGVTVVFVELENVKLELLQPLGQASPIASFLAKQPAGGMHHLCMEVPDVKECIEHVQKTVRTLTDEPKIGAHNKPVVFLHPKDCNGVLLELEQA